MLGESELEWTFTIYQWLERLAIVHVHEWFSETINKSFCLSNFWMVQLPIEHFIRSPWTQFITLSVIPMIVLMQKLRILECSRSKSLLRVSYS